MLHLTHEAQQVQIRLINNEEKNGGNKNELGRV